MRERESDRTPRAGAVRARSSCSQCGWRCVRITRRDVTCVAAETSHAFFLCQQLCEFFFRRSDAERVRSARLARRRCLATRRCIREECIKRGNKPRYRKRALASGAFRTSAKRIVPDATDMPTKRRQKCRNRRLVQRTNQNCANFFPPRRDSGASMRASGVPERRRPHPSARPSRASRGAERRRRDGDFLSLRASRRSRRPRARIRAARHRWPRRRTSNRHRRRRR